jgi:hypothetical protein
MRSLGTMEVGAADFVEKLHWVRRDLLLASLGGVPSRVAALDPVTGRVLSVHPRGGTVLYSEPAGDALVSPGRAVPRHRPGAAGRLRRQEAARGGALDTGRLGRRGLEQRGLPGPPVDSRPRRRAVGRPSSRRPGRRAGGRGQPGLHASQLSRPQRAGFAPRTPARLARAGRAREDDRRPRPKRRLAADGAHRRQRRPVRHRRGRRSGGNAGRALPHRPERLERAPRERRAEPRCVQGRRPPGLRVEAGLGATDADRLQPGRDTALHHDSRGRFRPGERKPPVRDLVRGTQFEVIDLETGRAVDRAAPRRETWLFETG